MRMLDLWLKPSLFNTCSTAAVCEHLAPKPILQALGHAFSDHRQRTRHGTKANQTGLVRCEDWPLATTGLGTFCRGRCLNANAPLLAKGCQMIRWDGLWTLASGELLPCCAAQSGRTSPDLRSLIARVKALAPVLASFPLLPGLAREGTEFASPVGEEAFD